MEEKVLSIKEIFPNDEVLESILGKSYIAFSELKERLAEYNIIPEWNYYNDAKCWLCKLLLKKKNLAWLSANKGSFIMTCYFLERHLEDVEKSAISQTTKEAFYVSKSWGKLTPMTIVTSGEALNNDIIEMIMLKKTLK